MYRDLPSDVYGEMDKCRAKLPDLPQATGNSVELSVNKDKNCLCFLRQANPYINNLGNLLENDVFYL